MSDLARGHTARGYTICPGTLDAPTGLTPKAHIYPGSKGDCYDVPDDGLLRREEFEF